MPRFDRLLVAITIVFAVLVARPFEVVRGGLDAGVYANTGMAIVRTGGIVQHDAVVSEIGTRVAAGDRVAAQVESSILGVQHSGRYLATRLRTAGFLITSDNLPQGRVVPQFLHLWPTWIAVWISMFGLPLGLVATGLAGIMGVVLLGLTGRALGGTLTGLLAAAFLALLAPQVWFSRMPTSEAFAQVLILGGLWAYIHFTDARDRRQRIWWGVVTGAAFGELALTRIDCFLSIGIVVALLGYTALRRRWNAGHTAMALAGGVLLGHAALHALFIARAYIVDTGLPTFQHSGLLITLVWPLLSKALRVSSTIRHTSYVGNWRRMAEELVLLSIPIMAVGGLWRWPAALSQLEAQLHRRRRVLLTSAGVLVGLLAAYAYLIRPGILTPAVLRSPLRPDNWLRIQGYVGAPIYPPFDRYPTKRVMAIGLANMVRLGWYLSPLGIVLGTIGAIILVRRVDRRSWLFVLMSTAYAIFYITSLQGDEHQTYIYILRRFIPLVYPAFALAIALAFVALKDNARRSAGPGGHPLAAIFQTGLFATTVTSFLLFLAVTGRPVFAHTEYAGVLEQVDALSQNVHAEDILLVRGGGNRDLPDLITTPLTYIFGRNAFAIKSSEPAKYAAALTDQVNRWRATGRQVYLLLGANGGDLLFPGYELRSVKNWTLRQREFQQLTNQKPHLSYVSELPFHLYQLLPAQPAERSTSLTADDTGAQVAGFYPSESFVPGDTRAAWTNGSAVLRLPVAAQGHNLVLHLAGGKRPPAARAPKVCLDVAPEIVPYPAGGVNAMAWQEVTCTGLEEQAKDVGMRIPTAPGRGIWLVRMRSSTWTPAETAGVQGEQVSLDRRVLGIRFVGATIEP
ncbi:MAG: hypothetical protein NVS2B7_23890 [Herpetosiphon sp.]